MAIFIDGFHVYNSPLAAAGRSVSRLAGKKIQGLGGDWFEGEKI